MDYKIELWEWLLSIVYILVIFFVSWLHKNRKIGLNTEYKYFLPGLAAKILGAMFYTYIYTSYYNGGDTTAYFNASVSYIDLMRFDFLQFLEAYFLESNYERFSFFNRSIYTGDYSGMLGYLYFDLRTLTVVRFVTPFVFVSLKSYLICNILISSFGYIAIWSLYKIFVSTYSQLKKELAISFLFFPSVLFWGAGISKDTIIIICVSVIITSLVNSFILKKRKLISWLLAVLFIYISLLIKPYVFYALAPGLFLWIIHDRILSIHNVTIRTLIIPFVIIFSFIGSIFMISKIENDKESYGFIYEELEHAAVIQDDLSKEYYGGNSFDIGAFDPTITGISKKIPIAVVSGILRPFLWEVKSVLMLFSSLEGIFLFILFLRIFLSFKLVFYLKSIFEEPILLFFIIYSLVFAFIIGLTTANFGALVRFKIPFIGFFLAGLFILNAKGKKRLPV